MWRVFKRRGGGVNRAPPKTGGGGVGKRAQLTGPVISDYELWRQRRRKFFAHRKWSIFSRTKCMPNDLSEPPRRADSNNPIFIFFFPNFRSGPLWGPGVSLGRILGGPSIEPLFGGEGVEPGGSIDPHPQLKARPPTPPQRGDVFHPSLRPPWEVDGGGCLGGPVALFCRLGLLCWALLPLAFPSLCVSVYVPACWVQGCIGAADYRRRGGGATPKSTPRAPAAAADRKQRPDATCEGKNG